MSANAREARAPWPLEKFKRALSAFQSSEDTDHQLAAVVVSGALAPVDEGHLHMLWQARERLQDAGYAVCGGWLSPSGDSQAAEKAQCRHTPALSLNLRLHLAELATKDDNFISVASWQGGVSDRSPDYVDIVSSLQHELLAALPAELWDKTVSVFWVCSNECRKCYDNLDPSHNQGLIIVPRRGIDTILEKPTQRIFVAEPVPGRLDKLNCTMLWDALSNGDTAYVRQAMPPAVARFLLEPTPAERGEFAGDLERLSVGSASSGPWPCAKLIERILAEPLEEGRVAALLVASGSMSPVHRGHLLMIHKAKERLEAAGYAVLAAWLSPAGQAKAKREASAKGSLELGSAFRQRLAELSVCEDPLITVGDWEAKEAGPARPREIAEALHQRVCSRLRNSLEGISVKTFYVCGSDVAEQQGVCKGFPGELELGTVIVERGDEEQLLMDLPHKLVFTTDAVGGDAAALSSTQLRAMVKAGDVSAAAQAMSLAAARLLLAPTASERAEFPEDFKQLGVSSPGAADLTKMQATLKTTLKSWAGPSGSIGAEELSRLLRMLDPSWTSQELDVLLQQATSAVDGRVDSDNFVDWIFSGSLQAVAVA